MMLKVVIYFRDQWWNSPEYTKGRDANILPLFYIKIYYEALYFL